MMEGDDRPTLWINLLKQPRPEEIGREVIKLLMSDDAKTDEGNRVIFINGS